MDTLPMWRSVLFCPAHVERFVAKAGQSGADAVLLDLEDSVPPEAKGSARDGLAAAARQAGKAGTDVLLRINRPLGLAVRDIEAAPLNRLAGLCLPKVDSAEQVALLAEVVAEREIALGVEPGSTRFLVLVESARGLQNIAAIAVAPRVVAMAVGGEDLATDLCAEPTADALYVPKVLGIAAARAAGIVPLGLLASVAGLEDDAGYRAMIARSRALGLEGATCVHPRQVDALNAGFGAGPEELEKARALIAHARSLGPAGRGAFSYNGRMVDPPVLKRAERLVSRAPKIEESQT